MLTFSNLRIRAKLNLAFGIVLIFGGIGAFVVTTLSNRSMLAERALNLMCAMLRPILLTHAWLCAFLTHRYRNRISRLRKIV